MKLSLLMQRLGHWLSTSLQYIGPWVSTLALCISVGAFVVSSWQYRAVTRHYRLSVRPQVNINMYLEGGLEERNGIYIANLGLGPAIIKDLSVEVDGKSYNQTDKRMWQSVFQALEISPLCFRRRSIQFGGVLKPGEEVALFTVTRANPPVVGEHVCHLQLLKLLKAEGLKVRVQYESMYGEHHEVTSDPGIDNDLLSEISAAMLVQMAPQLEEKLRGMVEQLTKAADQMEQSQADMTKRMAELAGQMLFFDLYEDPPGAPEGWWVWRMVRFRIPQDFGHR